MTGYADHVRRYLSPLLGHLLLAEVAVAHVEEMFEVITREHQAAGRRPRAVVWTAARVRHWCKTGEGPPVAVGTAAQTAQFLDAIAVDRLYAAYHLIALRGLRRGEAAGLRWCDVDLDAGTAVICRQLQRRDGRLTVCPPKTAHSTRVIALDRTTIAALRAHIVLTADTCTSVLPEVAHTAAEKTAAYLLRAAGVVPGATRRRSRAPARRRRPAASHTRAGLVRRRSTVPRPEPACPEIRARPALRVRITASAA